MKKITVAELLKGMSEAEGSRPERVDGPPASDQEAMQVAAKVAEMVAKGKICWCVAKDDIEGSPPCPMHPDGREITEDEKEQALVLKELYECDEDDVED